MNLYHYNVDDGTNKSIIIIITYDLILSAPRDCKPPIISSCTRVSKQMSVNILFLMVKTVLK